MYPNNINPYQYSQTYRIPNEDESYDATLVPTYYFSDGTPYYIDQQGTPYTFDQNGYITFYTNDWMPYYKNEFGDCYYLTPEGPVYFNLDSSHQRKKNLKKKKINVKKGKKNKSFSINFDNIEFIKSKKILLDIKPKNQKIITPYLSNHSIVRYQFHEIEKEPLEFYSWNLLNHCKIIHFNSKKGRKHVFNNSWSLSENDFQFKIRLHEQLNKILTIINSIKNLSCFFLQEISFKENFEIIDSFILKLKDMGWNSIFYFEEKNNENSILYNTKHLEIISEPISSFKKSATYDSVLQAIFYNKLNNTKIALGSIHLPKRTTYVKLKEEISDFNQKYNPENHLLLWCGDTNSKERFCYGNNLYPSLCINEQKKISKAKRVDKVILHLPKGKKVLLTEKPFYYFSENCTWEWSTKTIYEIDEKSCNTGPIEKLPYTNFIKYLSQIINRKFNGNVYINYKQRKNLYELVIYDKEIFNSFSKIMNLTDAQRATYQKNIILVNHIEILKIFSAYIDKEILNFFEDYNFKTFKTIMSLNKINKNKSQYLL